MGDESRLIGEGIARMRNRGEKTYLQYPALKLDKRILDILMANNGMIKNSWAPFYVSDEDPHDQ